MHKVDETKSFFGWIVVGAGTFLIFVVAGTTFYGMSIYLVPLQNAFGTSRSEISRAFAVVTLLNGILVPFVGVFVDRWGPKRSLLIGLGGLSVTFLLLSRISTLTHLYILVVVQGLALPFSGGLPNQTLAGRWFVRRRGRAMGMIGAGIGLGGLVLPWVLGVLVEDHGFRSAYLFTAILLGGVCLPVVVFLIRNSPADIGQLPDGAAASAPSDRPAKKRGLVFKHAVRLAPFWLILAAAALSQGVVGLVSMHLPALLQDEGLPLSTAGAYLGFMLGIGIGGRLLIGELSDTLKPRHLFLGSCFGMGVSALLLLRPDVPAARLVFVVAYGVFQGAASTVIPLVLQSLFGVRAFGRIYGTVLLFSAGTVAFGNYLGGLIYDMQGDYTTAVVLACALGVASGCLALMTRYERENEY